MNADKPPIHCRVKNRRPDLIPGLIALGGDINARDNADQTPLFGAVERLDAPEVEQMIQWGADPTLDAHSKIYGDYTLTKYALSWYNLFDSPQSLACFQGFTCSWRTPERRGIQGSSSHG